MASKPEWSCTEMWGSQDVLPLLPSLPQTSVRHGLCRSLLLSTSSAPFLHDPVFLFGNMQLLLEKLFSSTWPGIQQSGQGKQALIPATCFFLKNSTVHNMGNQLRADKWNSDTFSCILWGYSRMEWLIDLTTSYNLKPHSFPLLTIVVPAWHLVLTCP